MPLTQRPYALPSRAVARNSEQWTPPEGVPVVPLDPLDDDLEPRTADDVWADDNSLRNAVIGVAVAVVLVGALLVGFILLRGGDDVAAVGDSTTTSSTATTIDTSSTIGVLTPSTQPATTTTTQPVTLPVLAVTESSLDFGGGTNSLDLHVRNDGGLPLQYRVTTSTQAVLVSPAAGTIAPGAGAVVRVTLSRSGLSEGNIRELVTVDAGTAGSHSVAITAVTATPPTVVSAETAEPAVFAACTTGSGGPTTTAVSAVARDNSGIESVELRWTGPEVGRRDMTLSVGEGNDTNASAPIGPFTQAGDVTWEVVATDVHGNTGAAFGGTLEVVPCEP